MSGIKLNHIWLDDSVQIAQDFHLFFSQLGGASVLHLEGKDTSRCRVFVTLLHGNEPSGLRGIHRFLLLRRKPATNVKIIIASVVAAETEPLFFHRMLENQRDLNRCFNGPFDDLQGQLALAIIQQIKSFKPEAVVDMHNTSGSGPAFCVSACHSAQHLVLSSHFTQRTVFTDIRLGSIMEQDFGCPIITVEAGGSYDPSSDENAYLGICSYFLSQTIFDLRQEVDVLLHPRRLEINPGATLVYAEEKVEGQDITLRQDLEKYNFGVTPIGTVLGWISKRREECFHLDSHDQRFSEYFAIQNGSWITVRPLKLFMVTTRQDIALSDCAFYFVEEEEK